MCEALTPEQAYRLQFLGYGNPSSPVWFIGIEEGGEWGEAKPEAHRALHLDGRSAAYDPRLPVADGRESSVWRISRQLAHAAGVGEAYFLSNMAPFPRPALTSRLAGIDACEYVRLVRDVRMPWLIGWLRALRPSAVVFHGKTAWRAYGVREALELPLCDARVQLHPDHGLAFAPFFSRRLGILSKADIEALTAFLRMTLASAIAQRDRRRYELES